MILDQIRALFTGTAKVDGHVYEYVQGDCVVEFNRDGHRTTVLIEHGEVCGCRGGKGFADYLQQGHRAAWREVERAYQASLREMRPEHPSVIARKVW